MKKLIIILLLVAPFITYAAPTNYLEADIYTEVNISEGKYKINWLNYRSNTFCDDGMRNEKVFWKLATSNTWIQIYGPGYTGAINWVGSIANNRTYLEFTELPGEFFGKDVDIRWSGDWCESNSGACGGSCNGYNYYFNYNNRVQPLTAVSVSSETFCDAIGFSWTLPSYEEPSVGIPESSARQVQVFSGHNNVAALAGQTASGGLAITIPVAASLSGVDQNYTIRPILNYGNGRIAIGEVVNVTGRTFPLPTSPTSLFVDQLNCNGAMQVNWSWPITANPSNFIVQKSQNIDFSAPTNVLVSGADRTYRDNATVSGGTYFFRIFAQNTCPNNPAAAKISQPSVPTDQVGNGVPPATTLSNLSVNPSNKSVTVNWADNTALEDGYTVVRTAPGAAKVEFSVAKDITTYTDQTASTCTTYTYQVKTTNSCTTSDVLSTNSKTAFIPSDVSTTFDSTNNKAESTDGEFGDRVDIKWKTTNRQNEDWIINRINPILNDTTQIASLPAATKYYTDYTANANTLYKYEIHGESDCGGALIKSNTTSDIGFRLAFGTVNGQVTYQGGTAVDGVKVTATPASGASGYSGGFTNGTALATVKSKATLESDTFTVMAYVKPTTLTGSQSIMSKIEPTASTSGWDFIISGNNLALYAGNQLLCAGTSVDLVAGNWNAVAVSVSTDSIRLYVKGKKIKSEANTTAIAIKTIYDIKLGDGLTGNIDEVCYYTRGLTDLEVFRASDVYINPSAKGLRGYWRFDEGFGNTAYDYSKTILTANKNHATLNSVTWSTSKPSNFQLSAGAYTDELGSYFIPFIPYLGSGDNYTITPQFGTHSFTPATTTLLVGSSSANYSSKDFLDNSSFKVTGTVNFENTSCVSEGVIIKIDGQAVVRNGEVAMTTDKGAFDIQVPIGPHVITVEKTSHYYSEGRFPSSGTHDFQQNITGINFKDSTLVKVVGRVAGGSIQKDLPTGLGKGTNNIGAAKIVFKAKQSAGCKVDSVTTNLQTGEYEINLPPLVYDIGNFSPTSNSAIVFGDNSSLDISKVPPFQKSKDGTDSIDYQKQRDFIYFVPSPSIDVLGKQDPTFYGADSIEIEDSGVKTVIKKATLSNLAHPVFKENSDYEWLISAFEIYENNDGAIKVLDSVPMIEGKIRITNSLANDPVKLFEYSLEDSIKFTGIQEYKFTAGQASTSVDGQNANNSFTKECQITAIPQTGAAADWKPNGNFFRGIIFGGRSLGSSFSTNGPDVVTMILRDPPGTESFATWSKGTSVTSTYSYENEAGIGASLNMSLLMGTKFSLGLGYQTPSEIYNNFISNSSTEVKVNQTGDIVNTTTNSVTISTGAADEFVGAGADLFFGRAMNMDFGLSQILTLIEATKCGGNITCVGSIITQNGKDYRLGTKFSMFAIPQGYNTEFVFTQAGIENSVIPKLENLRNQFLLFDPNYSLVAQVGDPNFGKSNDDPDFNSLATPDPENSGVADSAGQSYKFKGYNEVFRDRYDTTNINNTDPSNIVYTIDTIPIKFIGGVDSVWFYNKQIRLWEDAIRQNEKAKVLASIPERNISYQGGSSITYSETTERSEASNTIINFNMTEELGFKFGIEVGGSGTEIEGGISLSYNRVTNTGTDTLNTATFEYTIFDPDGDDEFSVDVFQPNDGFGPIFKTRGGQTSCPYQGEVKTKYYQPGTVLDKATIQLEQPKITASPASLFNIPASSQGNINLSLINLGTEDAVYSLKVLESSNPFGLILKIDGITPNRDFPVPAGSSILKLLTVEKGPIHIQYDSIALVFHSQCQYAFGTANYDDIADTVYISVNFLPSCTELNVQAPQNQFIANNSNKQILPVTISGYDINYSGLDKIQLQYKPSNQASWIPLGKQWFYNKAIADSAAVRDSETDTLLIPRSQSYINYELELAQLIDQDYDLRAVSTCVIPFNPTFSQVSSVVSGTLDRVNPHPFGSPTPADGVLDPNDDISIQFNETIEAGSLTDANFQITGVLNGQELRHDIAVALDGATGFMEIANGFDFASRDFTVEFYAKRNQLGSAQTIISQGVNASNTFSIGFNPTNNVEVKIGTQTYSSTFSSTDTNFWHHYTVTYANDSLTLEITDRDASTTRTSTNNNFFSAYNSGGKTYVGKNSVSNSAFFNGSIHQLRIWNKALLPGVVSSRVNQNLNGREAGLIGYWPMDEGRGPIAEDKSRFRHAEMKANWELNPKSTALDLDGVNQYISVDSAGTLAINQEMDLSIEFWFKTAGGKLQTLLSNGGGMFTTNDANRNGWNIEMNAQNEIWVKNDSFAFKAVQNNFADDRWHHFALVVNRLANTTAYIDGNQQKTMASTNIWGFGAAKLVIGARYSINGTVETFDQYFAGNIDEVRIWNKALLRENIELNRYNRLIGNEFGLMAYYPFESYRLEVGVPVLDTSLANQSSVLPSSKKLNGRMVNGQFFTNESPAIALQRPVQKVNYSYSVNNDKIVILANEQPANIENVTLSITVQKVKDLRGNVMQSPKTWIAFVNKNQVLWQDLEKSLTKELNDTLTFTTQIVNSGGEVKNFTISNIPSWLTVTPRNGTISPLTTQLIRFTVNPSVNIGVYKEDLILTTDFGYNEKLLVDLKVTKSSPNFMVDPTLYQLSMGVIGQIRINNNISMNPDDKLVAFINGEVRGVANLQYMEAFDKYVAFLDIYSNSADSIYFQVWNASKGELHTEINPVLYFVDNQLIGSPFNPQLFDAFDNVSMPIVLRQGWNWVSFPLYDDKMSSLDNFFSGVNFSEGDAVKTNGNNAVSLYSDISGWGGSLSRIGITNDKSYLIKISQNDTLDYTGFTVDPDTITITVDSGWNRIGFVSLRNMQINTALANYNAQSGDVLKAQGRFSYYTPNLGWVGSLQVLEPTKGYLLNAHRSSSFVYPRLGLLRTRSDLEAQANLEEYMPSGYQLNPFSYEASTGAIVSVDICSEVISNEHIILAAYANGELRGLSESSITLSNNLLPQYYISAYGVSGDQFNFELVDTLNKEKIQLSGSLSFEKNGVIGTPEQPVTLTTKGAINCDLYKGSDIVATEVGYVYPNPFSNQLNITVPSDMGKSVEVSLVDGFGRVIYSGISAGGELLDWSDVVENNSTLSVGVYFVRFATEKSFKVEKVVKY